MDGEAMTPRRTFRAWPQTEALKANLAMFEHAGLDTRARVAEITGQLLDRYLAVEPAGLWQDRFGPGFRPMAADVPTSTFYHLLLAFTELLRLEPQLSKASATL
jgi:N-acylglucosamine 2-epimerase/mannose-6-phosphate isomerase